MSDNRLRCYYEVLNIEKTAKPEEIKISYRKLALIWHPDKNQNQLNIAEEKFKEINNAYTILSDPNERKWYDDHREAILRGGKGGSDDKFEDEINLWPYFNTACFTSFYDNDETGFYKVYSKIFDIIDKIEEGEELTNEYHYSPPKFGDSKTPISEVLKFYSYWKDFVTKKKFTNEDLYHLSDAPNRQIKRLMEKENQKERSKAKQQYNERVRHLASFIYNHDKRIVEYQKKCLEESERKQKEDDERKEKEEEQRQAAIKKFKQEKQLEYQRAKEAGQFKDDDNNLYQDESENSCYCVICDKAFKSEGQLENHQNSNKHKQELIRIRKSILMDDELTIEDNQDNENNNSSDDDKKPISNNKNKKSKKQKKKSKKVLNSNMFNNNSDEYVHGLVNKNKKKSKSKKSIESEEEEEEEEIKQKSEDEDDNLNSDDEDDLLVTSMLKNFIKDKNKKEVKIESEEESDQESEESEEEIKLNKNKKVVQSDDEDDDKSESEEESEEETKKPTIKTTTTTTTTTSKNKGKAKEKREKKAEKKQTQGTNTGESLFCNVCKGEFPTRNKLFQHIKESKHAQAVPSSFTGKKKK